MNDKVIFAVFWGLVGSFLTATGIIAWIKIEQYLAKKRFNKKCEEFDAMIQGYIDKWGYTFPEDIKESYRELGYKID